jgi:hypothetical protein
VVADPPPPPPPPPPRARAMTFGSPDIRANGTIPTAFTCFGGADRKGAEPRLVWGDVPRDAQSLALIVDDPDAPKGTYTHLAITNIAPDARSLSAGVGRRTVGWRPFCPPPGAAHRYRFTLFALRNAPGPSPTVREWTREGFARAAADRISGAATWYASFANPAPL